MQTIPRTIALAALLAALPGITTQNNLPLQPESRIWVKGGSTVRDYTCNARSIDAELSAGEQETAQLPIEELVRSADVSVAVAALECGNGTMNDHMRKALKATQHERLTFQLGSYTIEQGAVRISGQLTLAGSTLPVEFTGTVTEKDGGIVRVEAAKQIKMTEWGIKPPTLMLGTLKVHDAVTVGVDLLFKR